MRKPDHTATDKSQKNNTHQKIAFPEWRASLVSWVEVLQPASASSYRLFLLFCFQYLFSQEGAALEHYP